jgi:hypothetical protein
LIRHAAPFASDRIPSNKHTIPPDAAHAKPTPPKKRASRRFRRKKIKKRVEVFATGAILS